MPIATPEVYAEMLGRAKEHSFAFPAINCTARRASTPPSRASPTQAATASSSSPPAARSSPRAWASRKWSPARSRSPSSLTSSPRSIRSPWRCTPTTAPRTSSTPMSGRCWRSRRSGSPTAATRCSSRTCGTARRCRSTRTSTIARELLKLAAAAKIILEIEIGVVGGEEDGVEARDQRQALHHRRGFREDHRRAGHRRARQVSAGRDVRQRARRLQAGQRQASPRSAGRGPEGGGRQARIAQRRTSLSTSSSTAGRAR